MVPSLPRTGYAAVDNTAALTVHIKNHASDLVSLSLIMCYAPRQGAVGMWWIRRHYRTPALVNRRDGKAPDDKIRYVLIVICCPCTSRTAQPSKDFGHL